MKAVYAGSFDPFTNGHLDIVKQAAPLFEQIFVVISHNASKTRTYDIRDMTTAIQQAILHEAHIKNVVIVRLDGLVAKFAKEVKADYLIRGLRNTSDYQYEEVIAGVNKELNPELQTVYFRAVHDTISSSMVREFVKYEQDISMYVPKHVLEVMK